MRFRIDLKIFIFLIIFYFTKQIKIYAIVILFAFIHELGHLLIGLILGMKPERLEIMPFGLSISFKIKPEEYNQKIKKGNIFELKKLVVAAAGPLTNFFIIIIVNYLKIDMLKSLIIIYTNFLIMVFNLIPIYPLDGGRILKSVLHIFFGIQKSEQYINITSKVTIIIITALISILILYVHNIAMVLIDMYLWYLVIKEDVRYKKRKDIYNKLLENKAI